MTRSARTEYRPAIMEWHSHCVSLIRIKSTVRWRMQRPMGFVRSGLVPLLLLLGGMGAPVAPVAAASASTAIATPPRVAIDNFGQIRETYYRGAQPEGRD